MERIISRRDLLGEVAMIGGGLVVAATSEAELRDNVQKKQLLNKALSGSILAEATKGDVITQVKHVARETGLFIGGIAATIGLMSTVTSEVDNQPGTNGTKVSRSQPTRRDFLKRSFQAAGIGAFALGGYKGIQLSVDADEIESKQTDLLCGGPKRQDCITKVEVGCSGPLACGGRTIYELKTPTPAE